MPLTVPHLSTDGKTLIVPMANGTTVDVPIESVEYYSDAMIGFTTLRKQPHVIRFDSRRNNGKIARKLLDSKKHIIASKSEPKAESTLKLLPDYIVDNIDWEGVWDSYLHWDFFESDGMFFRG